MRGPLASRPQGRRASIVLCGLGGAPGWLIAVAAVALGCGRDAKSGDAIDETRTHADGGTRVHAAAPVADAPTVAPSQVSTVASGAVSAAVSADGTGVAPRRAGNDGGANALGATAASPSDVQSPVESPPDPTNQARPPVTSADLQERAAHLLDAIAKNETPIADDFFFPKAPFIPLKDVADPARYFDQLLATYHRDIASLRAERKDWSGVTFVSFELGTTPTWVAPGKEYNKIGYFRTFGGKLRYRAGDKNKEIAVSTIISWGGRWYVTHLQAIRH